MSAGNDFDVICIGAGMAGLTAGNLLTQKGYKVLIVERNPKVGGCSVNFTRKGFRFDTSIHFINGCKEGGMIYNILKLFDAHQEIDFIPLKEVIHWVDVQRGIDFHVPILLDDYVKTLTSLFPHEEKGIQAFYRDYSKVVRWLMDYVRKESFFAKFKHFFVHLPTSIRFIRAAYKPIASILNNYVQDPALREAMTALSTSFGLFPDEMSALNFLMAEMSYRFEGAFYPKGGAGTFSQKLASIFLKHGGTLLLRHEAVSVEIENDIVKRLILKDPNQVEKSYTARYYIISSDVTTFAMKLCPPHTLPTAYLSKIAQRIPSYSNVIVFLGLNLDLKAYGITDYELWRFGGTEKTPENIDRIIQTRDYSKLPIENIAIYSNIDPSCCPSGKSLLSAIYYTTYDPFKEFLTSDGKRSPQYVKEKERIKDQFLSWISDALAIHDLAEAVEVYEVATPLTIQKFTGNRNGANLGWRQTADQLMKDPLKAETPLKNVFLAGQWTFPAGGVASVMMSGYIASETIDKKNSSSRS